MIPLLVRSMLAGLFAAIFAHSTAAQQSGYDPLTRAMLDKMVGTISVSTNPTFSGGQLNGCVIEYAAFVQDFVYRQGGYSKIFGNFSLLKAGSVVAPALKVVVNDFNVGNGEAVPAAPASAYYLSGFRTLKDSIVNSYQSDTPGAIFVVFQPDPTLSVILEGIQKAQMQFAFARSLNGQDVRVMIDLTVKETMNDGQRVKIPENVDMFLQCAITLLKNAGG